MTTSSPVGRQRDMETVDRLKPDEHSPELVEIASERQRIIDDRADDRVGIDKEYGADGFRPALAGVDHAVQRSDVHRNVVDQREAHVDVFHSVELDPLANRMKPCQMAREAVDRQTDQLASELFEIAGHRPEGYELGCADRRKIGRMAEKKDPLALEIVGEPDRPLRRRSREGGGFLPDSRHGVRLIFHNFCL